jgi:site-specific recombinase XerD
LEHIRTFFNYLFTIKHTIFREPFKKINSERKIEKKLPNYLSIDEGKKLINLYNNSDKPGDIRDKAIICIFLNCGLRLSELKDLNIEDIDLENNKFQIIGKGNKERTGYLNELTKDALLKYLEVRDNSNDDPKARKHPLFITKYSERFNVKAIKVLIQKAYKLAGLDDKGYSVHTLRHTCATVLYKSGIDIRTIQKLLGHVQIDTTEIYTHLHDQKVMDVMLNHPLAKFKMADAIALAK